MNAMSAADSGWHTADGDRYKWATLNLRVANKITQNFEMQYDGSYQYMDLDPNGFSGREVVFLFL